jgi:rare lipoprotein A (peptidoglycan hydrolase)
MRNAAIACLAAVLMLLSARSEARAPVRYRSITPLRIVPAMRSEVGLATWYGNESSGETATGEIYDMNGLTAAHRTLPLNSRIKVTNLRNGRSLVLRVNDRGPNVDGRLLDVSEAAAERLGFIDSGKVPVRVTLLRYPPRYVAQPESHLLLASCTVSTE